MYLRKQEFSYDVFVRRRWGGREEVVRRDGKK
jgi:hypothetical protein